MANEAVFTVNIDTKELDEALAKLQQLTDALKARKEFNVGGGDTGGGGGASTRNKTFNGTGSGTGSRSEWGNAAPGEWVLMQRVAHDPKVTGHQSFISQFVQGSKQSSLSWRDIAKSLDRSQKSFGGIGRILTNFKTLGAFALGGGVVGGLMAAKDAAGDIAGRWLQAKQLGLRFGEADAFNDVFKETTGLDTSNLQAIAAAKADPTKIGPLAALGVTPQELASKDTVSLAIEAAQRAGEKYRMNPQTYGAWASAAHVDSVVDTNTARAASQMTPADWENLKGQYNDLAKQLAVSEQAQKDAAATTIKFNAAVDTAKTNIENAAMPLVNLAGTLAKEWGKDIAAFAKSDEVKEDIEGLSNAFKQLHKTIDWVSEQTHPGAYDNATEGGGLIDAKNAVLNGDFKGAWHILNTPIDNPEGTPAWVGQAQRNWLSQTPFGQKILGMTPGSSPASNPATFAALEKRYGLQPGTLSTIERIESNGNAKAVGPMTKYGWRALGAFQFSPDDLKRYNVADAMNEQAEAGGAAHKMADLLAKFKGNQRKALAAYNWGEGNLQTDIDQHGDAWENYLPGQTKAYLAKAGGLGFDFDNPVAQLSAPSNDLSNTAGGTMSAAADRFMGAANIVRNTFREGGGAQFRTPDVPAKQPVIKVYTAPGGNSIVTQSSLPGAS